MSEAGGAGALRADPIRAIDLVREMVPYLHCAPRMAGKRVLVVRCRGGHGARHLARSASRVEAYGGRTEIDWARANNPAANLIYRDEELAQPLAEEFDAACCFGGLPAGRPAEDLVERIAAALRLDGTLYLSAPSRARAAGDEPAPFEPEALLRLLELHFPRVEIVGIRGSARYHELAAARRAAMERLRGRDPLGLGRLAPRHVRERRRIDLHRQAREQVLASPHGSPYSIGPEDFQVGTDVATADDLLAVCRLEP